MESKNKTDTNSVAMNLRITPSMAEELNRVTERVQKITGFEITRSDIVRQALELGLAVITKKYENAEGSK